MNYSSSNGQPLLARFAELSSDILFVLDEANQIMLWNHSAERTFGHSRGEAIGRKAQDLGIAIGDKVDSLRAAVQNTEESYNSTSDHIFEQSGSFEDGRGFVIEWTLSPHVQNGQCVIACIGRNISEGKQAEEALKASEQRGQTLADVAPVGIYLTDGGGNCSYANRRWCEMAGMTIDEVVGVGWIRGLHPEDRQKVASEWQHMVDSNGNWGLEYRFQTPDGVVTWVQGVATPIRDADGKITGYVGCNADITERKRAEMDLEHANALIQAVYENTDTLIYSKDRDSRILAASPAIAKALGLELAQIVGHIDTEFHMPEIAAMTMANDQEVMQSRTPQAFEETVNSPQGPRTYFSTKSPFFNKQKDVIGVIGISIDITERKRAEAELASHHTLLHDSEERYRLLVENTLFPVIVTSLVDNRVLFANEFAAQFFGFSSKTAVGQYAPDFWCDVADRERIIAMLKNGEPVIAMEVRMRTQSGEEKAVLMSTSRIEFGGIPAAFTVIADITERKLFEMLLEQKDIQLAAINDYAPVMMCLLDEERNVLRANRAMTEFVGGSISEFGIIPVFGLLECVFSLDHPDGCGFGPHCKQCSVRKAVADTLTTGNSFHNLEREFTLLRNGREERFVFSISCALMNVGTDSRLLLYLQDITEVTNAVKALKESGEQLRQLNAHVDSLLEADRKWVAQEIHDDLGQLLTALKMDIAWTKKRIPEDSRTLSDKLEVMTNLTDSAMNSVRKIATRLRPIPVEAMGFAEAIEWLVKEIAEHSELAYTMDIDMGGRIFNTKQCTALYRILQESLNNVVRHADASHAQINLHTNQESIILQVKDNGRGIDYESIDAFSSIGLIGMRERARFLGGDVKIEPATLGGTIVIAQIPLNESEDYRD